MRRFQLVRDHDVSGVSGTGQVAEGVEFTNGKAVLCWLSDKSSVALYESLEDLVAIHGHGGYSHVELIDE
jgi:hypothetical protein